MPPTINPRRSEVWPVSQPGDPHAPRPCLIISENERNQYATSVLVVPIWTSSPQGPTRVPLRAGEGGIAHASVLVCDDVTRIHKRYLGERAYGSVTVAVLKKTVQAIRIAIGDPTA